MGRQTRAIHRKDRSPAHREECRSGRECHIETGGRGANDNRGGREANVAALGLHARELTDREDRAVWLAARVAVAATCLLAVGLFLASLPARYHQLWAIGVGDRFAVDPMRGVDPALVPAALARLHLTVGAYAAGSLAFEVALALVFGLVALVVVRHRRQRSLALVTTLALVLLGTTYPPTLPALVRTQPELETLVGLLGALGFALALVMFYIFPDGRFFPRWTGPLALVWVAWQVASALVPTAPFAPGQWPPLLTVLVPLPWWLSGLVAQVVRYRRVAGPAQRQQTKWALWGMGAAVLGANAALLPQLLDLSSSPTPLEALAALGSAPLGDAFTLLAALSLGIAILRYRLWDIDLLLNRTLVYVPLTAIMAGLFAAGLGVFQRLFVALTGDRSDAAVVLTTLVIAAAFEPIRTGLRTTVDRYFREAPDRTRLLRSFGEQLRWVAQVIDVAEMTRRVLDEAVAAFEAECGELSLLANSPTPLRHTRGDWHEDRARLSVLLESGGVRVGLIALGARRGGGDYTPSDQQLLRSIAATVATVVRVAGTASGPPQTSAPPG
jgi:hypothetical protein